MVRLNKTYDELSNVGKATILFTLFPEHFDGFYKKLLWYIDCCQKNKADVIEAFQENSLVTGEYWLALGLEVKKITVEFIHKRNRMNDVSKVARLFHWHNGAFCFHVISLYVIDIDDCKFKDIAKIFI